MGIGDWWSTDSIILTCYSLAYWYSTIEQQGLAWIRALFTRIGRLFY
jgi:hypothetical protein